MYGGCFDFPELCTLRLVLGEILTRLEFNLASWALSKCDFAFFSVITYVHGGGFDSPELRTLILA